MSRASTKNTDPAISRAAQHARVRQAHSAETAEDYVEAIADIIAENAICRCVDLTRHFGVSHVTVIKTIARLKDSGLVDTEPRKPITLTPQGKRLAAAAKHRHEIIVQFLLSLGLDQCTAQTDAEGIEHHVSPKTLKAFQRFVKTHNSK